MVASRESGICIVERFVFLFSFDSIWNVVPNIAIESSFECVACSLFEGRLVVRLWCFSEYILYS